MVPRHDGKPPLRSGEGHLTTEARSKRANALYWVYKRCNVPARTDSHSRVAGITARSDRERDRKWPPGHNGEARRGGRHVQRMAKQVLRTPAEAVEAVV
jgi:hypothetical protein